MKTASLARLADVLRGLSGLLCLGFLVMWPFSYGFYTSVGIDTDQADGDRVIRTHHRFRWHGDGSFRMGAEGFWLPASEPFDAFDLGGVFFREPRRLQPRSSWNHMGFWFVREENQNPDVPTRVATNVWSFWVGVPSWLPPLLTGLWPALGWARKRRLRESPGFR